MKLLGFDHIHFTVKDLDEAIGFYGKLGFTLVRRLDHSGESAQMSAPGGLKMDLYLAESDKPTPVYTFIHGGGFRSGDKTNIPQDMLENLLQAGISLAAINYRLSGTDPYPAAMKDCVRALDRSRHEGRLRDRSHGS